jgi:hypothetical protein
MIACSDIIAYLNDNYNYVKSLSELSNNEKIKSTENAFNFDDIKGAIYGEHCASADALLIKRNLNLIEFKTGFDAPEETLPDKIRKENLLLKIRIKAYESLHLLQTAIIDEISPDDKLADNVKFVFCAVIDTAEKAVAEDLITDIISDAGGIREEKSFKVRIIENGLAMYRKQTDKRKKLFYDETFVLYDYEFDSNVHKFK